MSCQVLRWKCNKWLGNRDPSYSQFIRSCQLNQLSPNTLAVDWLSDQLRQWNLLFLQNKRVKFDERKKPYFSSHTYKTTVQNSKQGLPSSPDPPSGSPTHFLYLPNLLFYGDGRDINRFNNDHWKVSCDWQVGQWMQGSDKKKVTILRNI